MAITRNQDIDVKHPQSVGQRAVRGHDPGVLPGRGRDDRGVPSTIDLQQGNRPRESCRGTGSRDRAGDEAIQLLDHGRWHAERGRVRWWGRGSAGNDGRADVS